MLGCNIYGAENRVQAAEDAEYGRGHPALPDTPATVAALRPVGRDALGARTRRDEAIRDVRRKGCGMKHRTVRDVMTADVVTVTTSTRFKDLVSLLVGRRISGLPVLSSQGQVVGVVCETDLLVKEEFQRDPGTRPVTRPHRRALRVKAAGDTAGEVMTTRPVTVRPDARVAEAARLMDRHHVGCLPVVDEDGGLAGTVSPRELLRVFLRPDGEIRAEIIDEVLVRYLGTNPALVSVDVTDGVVTLCGEVEYKSMLPLVLPVTRAVDGVVDVEGQLTYGIDDTRLPPVPDLHDY